jgi:hypothetical protein
MGAIMIFQKWALHLGIAGSVTARPRPVIHWLREENTA